MTNGYTLVFVLIVMVSLVFVIFDFPPQFNLVDFRLTQVARSLSVLSALWRLAESKHETRHLRPVKSSLIVPSSIVNLHFPVWPALPPTVSVRSLRPSMDRIPRCARSATIAARIRRGPSRPDCLGRHP